MQYQNDNNQLQSTASEKYIVNEDTTDNDKNWDSSDAIQIIKNCFETYEVCPESHLNKTEITETEIPIDNRVSNENKNNLPEEHASKVQGRLPELQSASYDKLEVVETETAQIVCNDNIEQSELIYQNLNETPSYFKVEYNNLVNNEDEDNIEFQGSIELPGSRFKNHIQLVERTEGYSNGMLNNSRQDTNCDKRVIVTQADEKDDDNVNIFNDKSYQEMQEIGMAKRLIDMNSSQIVNEIASEPLSPTKDMELNQNDDCALNKDKTLGNYQAVVTDLMGDEAVASANNSFGKNHKLLRQAKQRLYIHNEPLTSIIVQNKFINIIPRQCETTHDQQNKSKARLNKNRKFTLMKKHVQAVNIQQNGNQNTILLLTNDALQNSVLRIDESSTVDNEIQK